MNYINILPNPFLRAYQPLTLKTIRKRRKMLRKAARRNTKRKG